ncbi:MAG TPA: UvrD-helicase domain-containing protein [Vicinamibacterales bacterium]|jgi:ATP-dependent exoDNAse (exonuclease V) beta subunit
MTRRLADERDRSLIASALDDTLIVEAAAGTGKTTELVRRIVRVIETGRAEVTEIVAVTFTEKAAGELKLRLREALEEARRSVGTGSREQHRLDEALRRLEEAQVSTIHGFCADLLRERPVEAQVDPLFNVLTEAQAARMYDASFHNWFQQQLINPPEGLQRSLRRPSFGGFQPGPDRDDGPIARLRSAGWDLIQWRDFVGEWQRVPFDRTKRIDGLVEHVHEFVELARDPSYARDTFFLDTRPARQLSEEIKRTESVTERDYNRLEGSLIGLGRNRDFQRARKGTGKLYRPDVLRETVTHARDELQAALLQFEADANADLAARLHEEFRGCIESYEQAKARAGALDFLDLLLKARDLVKRDAGVRKSFQQRFKRIFVDEFQDTDPLQAEILLLLGADDASISDWSRICPVPGKLFIVGDPKQSIYRFRRADVGIYQHVYKILEAAGAKRVRLKTSFRARPNIQQVVNTAFEPLMNGDPIALQANYVPLESFRSDATDQPSVVVLPVPKPYAIQRVANTRIEESLPRAVGALVDWLVHESGWTVTERPAVADPAEPVDDRPPDPAPAPLFTASGLPLLPFDEAESEGGSRTEEYVVPIQARHICLLFRRFVSYETDVTRPYVEALEARGIPHLLVGGRSFHNRGEIETLRAALAAIEWPDDELSVFATLRGTLFALGDEELLEYRQHFGRFHPFRIPKDVPPHLNPIVEALRLLQALHRSRNHVPVATTISSLLGSTRAHVRFVLEHGGEQVLANVLHVAELARRYEADGGISFRGFIDELRDQADDGTAAEAPILEEGSDGVRLMTVHKAKGLEFPVVILADMTAKLQAGAASRYIDPVRQVCAIRLAGCSPFDLLQHEADELQRDRAEGVRVAYVAATRARDLLVIPAVGDEEREGWIEPMNRAIYPLLETRRSQVPAPGCPEFPSKDSVLFRPNGDPALTSTVSPGLHVFGSHQGVVWWDPRVLNLDAEAPVGIRRSELIVRDVGPEIVQDGLTDYRAWRTRRDAATDAGAKPTIAAHTVTQWVQRPDATTQEGSLSTVELVELPRVADRPSGPRFGALVHAVLATIPLNAEPEAVARLTVTQAQILGATEDEVDAATRVVQEVLVHPLLQRAFEATRTHRCRREVPIAWRDGNTLIEGVIDLAFEDDTGWLVLDFKTDEELRGDTRADRQVGLYAAAVSHATRRPASGVVVRI